MQQRAQGCGKKQEGRYTCKNLQMDKTKDREKQNTERKRGRAKKKKSRHIPLPTCKQYKRKSTQNMQHVTHLQKQWKLMRNDLPFSSVYVVCVCSLSLFGLPFDLSVVFEFPLPSIFWIVQLVQTAPRYPNPSANGQVSSRALLTIHMPLLDDIMQPTVWAYEPCNHLIQAIQLGVRPSPAHTGGHKEKECVETHRHIYLTKKSVGESEHIVLMTPNIKPKLAQGNAFWGPQNQWSEKHARNLYGCKGPPQYFVCGFVAGSIVHGHLFCNIQPHHGPYISYRSRNSSSGKAGKASCRTSPGTRVVSGKLGLSSIFITDL